MLRYFEQYGVCAPCPTQGGGKSIVAAIALPLLLLGFFVVLFMLRSMMPRGMMKVRGLLDFPEESAGRVVAVVFFG